MPIDVKKLIEPDARVLGELRSCRNCAHRSGSRDILYAQCDRTAGGGSHMRVKVCKCPGCNHKLSGVTPLGRRRGRGRPSPGDMTVCVYCASLLVYSRSERLRLLTAEELSKLSKPRRTLLLTAQREIQRQRTSREEVQT